MKTCKKNLPILIVLIVVTSSLSIAQNKKERPWPRHTIDASSSGADGVKLADFNKDGQIDIVTGWEEGGITKLYLYPEKNQLKHLWPSVELGKTPDVEDAVFADVNGDGILDVISCTEGKTQKLFIHFAPKENYLQSENWKTKTLPTSEDLTKWMYAEPLQMDGKNGIDIIAAGKGEEGVLGWFESPKNPDNLTGWKWHKISNMGWVMSMILRDMDKDGDMDILVTDRYHALRACRWLENPGKGKNQKKPWKNHFIGAQDKEVMFMTVANLHGGEYEEVILVERETQTLMIFYQQDKKGLKWTTKEFQLPANIGKAKSVEAGDIDADGRLDLVISTNTYGDGKHGLVWIRNDELAIKGKEPKFNTISGIHNAKYDKVELWDIDQDGDLDVLICEENYGENSKGLGVIWYENTLNKR